MVRTSVFKYLQIGAAALLVLAVAIGAVYLRRETPSRHWIITTPSGFEMFFSRCADEFAKATPPDMGRIAEIFSKHGITQLEGGQT